MNEKEQVNEGYVIIESVTVGNARSSSEKIRTIRQRPMSHGRRTSKMTRITFSGVTTARPNWAQLQTSAGVSRRRPNFSVNE